MRSRAVVGAVLVSLLTLGAGYASGRGLARGADRGSPGTRRSTFPATQARARRRRLVLPSRRGRGDGNRLARARLPAHESRTSRHSRSGSPCATDAVVVAPTISSESVRGRRRAGSTGTACTAAVARLFADRTALEASAARCRLAGPTAAAVRPGRALGGRQPRQSTAAGSHRCVRSRGHRATCRAVVDARRGRLRRTDRDGSLPSDRHGAPAQCCSSPAPPSACNASGVSTQALLAARPGEFVGVQLQNGTHVDAEGRDTDLFGILLCGLPRPANVLAVQRIASDWIANALTGTSLGIVGGAPGEMVPVGGATAVVLPAWRSARRDRPPSRRARAARGGRSRRARAGRRRGSPR